MIDPMIPQVFLDFFAFSLRSITCYTDILINQCNIICSSSSLFQFSSFHFPTKINEFSIFLNHCFLSIVPSLKKCYCPHLIMLMRHLLSSAVYHRLFTMTFIMSIQCFLYFLIFMQVILLTSSIMLSSLSTSQIHHYHSFEKWLLNFFESTFMKSLLAVNGSFSTDTILFTSVWIFYLFFCDMTS